MAKNGNTMTYFKYKLIYYGTTLSVKGKYDITSYDDNTVIIKCADDIICVSGENLVIMSLDADEMYIKGKISDISFS